jgi:preprotein translocase subunit YajC
MYFLILRPNQQRAKAQRELTKSIEEGDEVMTGSGIYGYVTAIEGDVAWLEIADGVDIRVARAAISKKVNTTASTVTDAPDHEPDQEPDAAPDADDEPTGDASTGSKT